MNHWGGVPSNMFVKKPHHLSLVHVLLGHELAKVMAMRMHKVKNLIVLVRCI